MTSSAVGKYLGWGQFVLQALASVFEHGVPTTPFAWLGLLGSFATAIGLHAASSTDGSK